MRRGREDRRELKRGRPAWRTPPLVLKCIQFRYRCQFTLKGTVSKVTDLSSRLLSGHCAWIVARQIPLLVCKLGTHDTTASLSITLSIQHDFGWTVTVGSQVVTSDLCPLPVGVPDKLASASAVCELLSTIDSSKHCPGNPEPKFLEQWRQRSLTLHGNLVCHYVEYIEQIIYHSIFVFSGEQIAHINAALTGVQSLRHRSCQWFLASD